jgi:hypothetical protein
LATVAEEGDGRRADCEEESGGGGLTAAIDGWWWMGKQR